MKAVCVASYSIVAVCKHQTKNTIEMWTAMTFYWQHLPILFRMHFFLVHRKWWTESEYFATILAMIWPRCARMNVVMFLKLNQIGKSVSDVRIDIETTNSYIVSIYCTESFFLSRKPCPQTSHFQRSLVPGLCSRLCSIKAFRFGDRWPHTSHVCGPYTCLFVIWLRIDVRFFNLNEK